MSEFLQLDEAISRLVHQGDIVALEGFTHLIPFAAGHEIIRQDIRDLTSGFRAVRAHKFREFLYLLPNGFSYPTTSTMAFCRAVRRTSRTARAMLCITSASRTAIRTPTRSSATKASTWVRARSYAQAIPRP